MRAPAAIKGWPRWQLVAVLAAVLGLAGFAIVTVAIYGHGPLLEIDRSVARTFAAHRSRWLIDVLTVETGTAAFYPAAAFLLLICIGVALQERSRRPLALGASAVVLLGISVATGKQVIGRSRIPFSADAFGAGGTSYPSGHTTTAVVVGGCLLLLFARRLSASGRRLAIACVAAFAVVTGFSRIYLHDHWFTDVLAGWLLGTAIVCTLALAYVRESDQPRTLA